MPMRCWITFLGDNIEELRLLLSIIVRQLVAGLLPIGQVHLSGATYQMCRGILWIFCSALFNFSKLLD
jgi:hypothetical protein